MEIWFALIIPVVAVIILYVFFHKKIAWWESIMILVIISIVIMLMKYGTEVSQTSDKEYLMDYEINAQKFDEWDEEVPCRHEIPCSHPKYCEDRDKDGKVTGEHQCGYEHSNDGYYHPYDVDVHPEYCVAGTHLGRDVGISRDEYERLVVQWKATPIFVDMHRDYHSIDGDKHYVNWNGDVNTVESLTFQRNYENRVQATHTILNFPEVDTADVRYYTLKEYPDNETSLLGEGNSQINKYINQSNSLFASEKQVKIFYLIFKNQPLEAALKQEQYWKGGNKNEVNICIGIDNNRKIKWSYVFSWTKKEIVKIQIRDSIMSSKVLSNQTYKSIIDYSNSVIVQKFERRQFKEFSYLTVEPTKGCVLWTFILSFILTVGLAVWVVNNGIDVDGINTDGYKYDSYNRYRNY